MKTGIVSTGGLSGGCGCQFEVWGVAANAPPFFQILDLSGSFAENTLPYFLQEPGIQSEFETPISYEFIPEQWDRNDYVNSHWKWWAVKVPASYPVGCDENAPQHSGAATASDPTENSGGDGTWEVELPDLAEHKRTNFGPNPEDNINEITYWRFCFATRAIYVDGAQTYLNYRVGDKEPKDPLKDHYAMPTRLGVHCVINIASKTMLGEYRVEFGISGEEGRTASETFVYENLNDNVVDTDTFRPCGTFTNIVDFAYIPPANCIYQGKEYSAWSTYSPDRQIGSNMKWSVGRVKYEGTRLGSAGLEVFSSQTDLGEDGSPADPIRNDYVIVLPTVRAYLDSSADQPDEPWVLCLDAETYNSKMITTKWQSKEYRIEPEGDEATTHEREMGGYADGTVSAAEAAAGNVLFDTTNPASQVNVDFPDETWDNLKVRCYNRVYDPTTGHSEDLVIFQTAKTAVTQSGIVADFEDGVGGFDPQYLNHGLPDGLTFTDGGTPEGNEWLCDATESKNGTNSATSNINAAFSGVAELRIVINVTTTAEKNVSFWYRFDNRGSGKRFPGMGYDFTQLSPFPVVDHILKVLVDGSRVPIEISNFSGVGVTDYSLDGEVGGSYIDNVNVPDDNDYTEDFYFAWRQAKISVPAGTHVLSFVVNRRFADDSYTHLQAWLDDIEFPELMIGDDLNNAKRWFYAKGKVRECKYWAYAKRDDESQIDLVSRVSVVPDFITMDKEGRILMGNPHWLCRVLIDEDGNDVIDESFGSYRFDSKESGKGYIRFTASPNIGWDENPCFDRSGTIPVSDVIADPGWGAFQILPTATGYQVRGANAAPRDATEFPINEASFKYANPRISGQLLQEYFRKVLMAVDANWASRPTCWSISEDGSQIIPHVEVLWRPTYDQPAWPERPPYASPPYMNDFENSETDEFHDQPGTVRIRDPFTLPADSTKDRWTPSNYIVARGYSNAFTKHPQVTWRRIIQDPANPGPYDTEPTPWNSAKWHLVLSNFCPAGLRIVVPQVVAPISDEYCPDPEDPETIVYAHVWQLFSHPEFETGYEHFWPFIDYDVVDDSVPCCGGG